jgi:ADP-ribose pyrophosphatase YjhB (NUDIX family)
VTDRKLFANALVMDPDGLFVVVWNHVTEKWELPCTEVRPSEDPTSAAARTLRSQCGVGARTLVPIFEDDVGRDGRAIVYSAVVDGMPAATRPEAEVRAMTSREFLARTAFPRFHTALFAIAEARKLFGVIVERRTPLGWRLDDEYLHALTSEEAERLFLIGEQIAYNRGDLRIVAVGQVIGFHVKDKRGEKLSA